MTKAEGSPVEVAGAWLRSVLDGGGWREAKAIEAERAAAGISARALTTARGRLVRDGRVEKRKAGRGAWSYRLVERVPPPEPAPAPEAADPEPDPEPAGRLLEVPERFAQTARLLACPALVKDVPEDWAVLHALQTLAADCGYRLEKESWQSSYNPKLMILKLLAP